jgi:F-type H+-transporting ATPase subunit b
MADIASLIVLAAGAAHESAHGAEIEPSALGLAPGAWVALSMAVLIAVALYLKVPKTITGGLDKGIAEIKHQLEEAKALRAEAEALRKEYADKIANAEREAAEMLAHARHEAEAIVAKAEVDTTDLIARREKMASEKITAAELAAVQDLRNKAAAVAAAAAGALIRSGHNAAADKPLVDQAIAGL